MHLINLLELKSLIYYTVLVSLYLAGHDLKGDVDKISDERNIPAFHIRSTMKVYHQEEFSLWS
jgi:hypothetical protein